MNEQLLIQRSALAERLHKLLRRLFKRWRRKRVVKREAHHDKALHDEQLRRRREQEAKYDEIVHVRFIL